MQAAPARYVSVSELYSTDEVELLLDEIRELEPTSCRGEDVQDFEIAGSGFGVEGGGGGGGGGGRSPAGTEATERSWDSHAQYRRAPPPRPLPIAPLYCRLRYLLTFEGALTLLIVVGSLCSCTCIWCGVGVRGARQVPLPGRVRLLQLGGVTSVLVHGALAGLQVTRLAALLPLPWRRVAALAAAWSGAALGAGGALVAHAVLAAPQYRPAPPRLAALLLAAAGAGGAAALAAVVLVAGAAHEWWAARPLTRRPLESVRSSSSVRAGAAYRAVPVAAAGPPPHLAHLASLAPQPSTSRDDPL